MTQSFSYKRDSLVQVWLDRRTLAVLAQWMEERGASPNTLSNIVRWPLEKFAEMLVEQGQAKAVDITHEAKIIMDKYNLNPKGRGKKNLMENLQLDVARAEMVSPDGDIITGPLTKEEKDKAISIAKGK